MSQWLIAAIAAVLVGWLTLRLLPAASTRALLRAVRPILGLRRREVRVAGETWPYLEAGPGSAPIILFVHGFGADKDMWLTYARQFRGRYRAIAPDLPGFGEADRREDRDYSPRAQARRLAAFCDALRIKDAHVVGSSMGGFVSAWLAIDRADLVRTLTLMNAAGVFGSAPSVVQTAAESGENPLVATTEIELKALFGLLSHVPLRLPRFLRQYLLENYRNHEALLDRIFWQLVEAHEGEGLEAALGRVRAPTLVLWGREDQILDPSCAEVFTRNIPGARLVMLDGVGHVPMLEAPALAAAAQVELFAGKG
jgi:pimeloyl-ACP methyl ester carboxylesterase